MEIGILIPGRLNFLDTTVIMDENRIIFENIISHLFGEIPQFLLSSSDLSQKEYYNWCC